MEYHPAATIFPLDEKTIGELADDIRAHGQRVPIELLDGMVLDGRRRWLACGIAQVKPETKEVQVADPVAYVLSLNLHRRHLDDSQRAMVGARAKGVHEEIAKQRQRTAGGDKKSEAAKSLEANVPQAIRAPQARDLAGAAVGVSGKLIDKACAVLRRGSPELIQACDEGRVAVSTAESNFLPLSHDLQRAKLEGYTGNPGRRREWKPETDEPDATPKPGKGLAIAHEAIHCLRRIPQNDSQRKAAFALVIDYCRHNGKEVKS